MTTRSRPASIDETPQAAIWRVLPGSAPEEFPYEFHGNELMHVLEGVLEVAVEGGETVTIRAGEVAYFPAGTRSTWRLTTPLRKLFIAWKTWLAAYDFQQLWEELGRRPGCCSWPTGCGKRHRSTGPGRVPWVVMATPSRRRHSRSTTS